MKTKTSLLIVLAAVLLAHVGGATETTVSTTFDRSVWEAGLSSVTTATFSVNAAQQMSMTWVDSAGGPFRVMYAPDLMTSPAFTRAVAANLMGGADSAPLKRRPPAHIASSSNRFGPVVM